MQEEYDLSKNHGNFLIPVGATGYKTKDLWTQQMSAHDNSFSPTKTRWNRLMMRRNLLTNIWILLCLYWKE